MSKVSFFVWCDGSEKWHFCEKSLPGFENGSEKWQFLEKSLPGFENGSEKWHFCEKSLPGFEKKSESRLEQSAIPRKMAVRNGNFWENHGWCLKVIRDNWEKAIFHG